MSARVRKRREFEHDRQKKTLARFDGIIRRRNGGEYACSRAAATAAKTQHPRASNTDEMVINHSLEGYGDWEIGEIDVRLTRTGDNTVSPKTTMRLGGPPITIGPDDLRHQDGLFLYVWGAASYRDGFGKRRFTRFCHRYNCVNFTQHPQLGGIAIDAVHARYHRLGNDAN
jgi:hypothetical protein